MVPQRIHVAFWGRSVSTKSWRAPEYLNWTTICVLKVLWPHVFHVITNQKTRKLAKPVLQLKELPKPGKLDVQGSSNACASTDQFDGHQRYDQNTRPRQQWQHPVVQVNPQSVQTASLLLFLSLADCWLIMADHLTGHMAFEVFFEILLFSSSVSASVDSGSNISTVMRSNNSLQASAQGWQVDGPLQSSSFFRHNLQGMSFKASFLERSQGRQFTGSKLCAGASNGRVCGKHGSHFSSAAGALLWLCRIQGIAVKIDLNGNFGWVELSI